MTRFLALTERAGAIIERHGETAAILTLFACSAVLCIRGLQLIGWI